MLFFDLKHFLTHRRRNRILDYAIKLNRPHFQLPSVPLLDHHGLVLLQLHEMQVRLEDSHRYFVESRVSTHVSRRINTWIRPCSNIKLVIKPNKLQVRTLKVPHQPNRLPHPHFQVHTHPRPTLHQTVLQNYSHICFRLQSFNDNRCISVCVCGSSLHAVW